MRPIVIAALCAVVSSCDRALPAREASPSVVAVEVMSGRITSPDTVQPGWAPFHVDEKGESHIVVVFRLPSAATDADVASFLSALDTVPVTPRPGIAMGGPEIGRSGEVIMHFTPGRYVVGCVSRDDSGRRHLINGESETFIVPNVPVDSARGRPPVATHDMRLTEFAYAGSDKWRAGPQLVRIENTGGQDHQLRLLRLSAGSSITDWLNSDGSDTHATPVVGIARMGPGETAYLPISLEAGSYVAYCLIPDPAKGKAHIELGMFRAIQVE